MTTENMTVHQALCELKTLDARISKGINSDKFVFGNKHSNTKVRGVEIEQIKAEIKSRYDSVTDLIRRRDAIKRALVLSNATTTVTIGGKQYTVAEAIEMKNHGMEYRAMLLKKLVSDTTEARTWAEKCNGDNLEARADEHIRNMFGQTDIKGATEDVKKAREEFIKQQTAEVVDPINAAKIIDELDKEINSFSVDVDSALSVSNAVTTIEVNY